MALFFGKDNSIVNLLLKLLLFLTLEKKTNTYTIHTLQLTHSPCRRQDAVVNVLGP